MGWVLRLVLLLLLKAATLITGWLFSDENGAGVDDSKSVVVAGCTDATATNFDWAASVDDGTCRGSVFDLSGVFTVITTAGAPLGLQFANEGSSHTHYIVASVGKGTAAERAGAQKRDQLMAMCVGVGQQCRTIGANGKPRTTTLIMSGHGSTAITDARMAYSSSPPGTKLTWVLRKSPAERFAQPTTASTDEVHAGNTAPEMRPAHTTKLTPKNFDTWVQNAIDNEKSAIVRWMASDDSTKNCEWLGKGFLFELDESEIEYIEVSVEPEFEVHVQQFRKLQKDMRTKPCAVCQSMAKAWNDVTLEYRDDPDVCFGDVVLSDPAVKAVSDKLKATYKPSAGYNGVEDYAANDGQQKTTHDGDNDDSPMQYGASRFDREVAMLAHHPHTAGGCAISIYNLAEEDNKDVMSPHCLDMLEPHEPSDTRDDDGNIVPPSPEELQKRKAMEGKLNLHQYVIDTKELLVSHLNQLEYTEYTDEL